MFLFFIGPIRKKSVLSLAITLLTAGLIGWNVLSPVSKPQPILAQLPLVDMGDAPDPSYPTLRGNDGAAHEPRS